MRKSNVITAILSTASLVWIAPAHAADVTLDYHLPEVKIGFAPMRRAWVLRWTRRRRSSQSTEGVSRY
jgi:hypothetical protein